MPKLPIHRIAALLLLGAATSLGVAWGLALLFSFSDRPPWSRNWRITTGISPSHDGPVWLVTSMKRPGMHLLSRSADSAHFFNVAEFETIADQLPRWSAARSRPEGRGGTAGATVLRTFEEHAFGWPLMCLYSDLESTFDIANATSTMVELHGGSRIGSSAPASRDWRSDLWFLPVIPLVLNFAANTVVYAAAWGTAFIVLALLRRGFRRMRGLCPVCGYNLLGDFEHGCAECGWNRDPAR